MNLTSDLPPMCVVVAELCKEYIFGISEFLVSNTVPTHAV